MTNMMFHCKRGQNLGHSTITAGEERIRNAEICLIHQSYFFFLVDPCQENGRELI